MFGVPLAPAGFYLGDVIHTLNNNNSKHFRVITPQQNGYLPSRSLMFEKGRPGHGSSCLILFRKSEFRSIVAEGFHVIAKLSIVLGTLQRSGLALSQRVLLGACSLYTRVLQDQSSGSR